MGGLGARARAEATLEDGEHESASVPTVAPRSVGPAGGQETAGEGSAPPSKRRASLPRRRPTLQGFAVREADLRQTPLAPPSGHIELHTIARQEDISVDIFNEDGSYNGVALSTLDHALRCKRTDSEKPIEPRLYVLLSHVYDHFKKPVQLVSGYRNQRRETSFHFKGSASDIRIEGVNPKKIREFASTLDTGGMGIGWYPRARFVHIDVRPSSYRWIDNAPATPNSPDKQPPRGWRRKKLQS